MKHLRIDTTNQPGYSVIHRYAMTEVTILFQPFEPKMAKIFNFFPTLCAGNDRSQRQKQNIK
ncbi:hypothetical protein [Idiomarina aminovorans]|uniref:hypothetical protein n=1 Tax=Idiomarina aminovorans TaxID=2914829 RepID=UPI002005EE2C|nr:hypothetical protein [Idiomarina sp. ATCH4]MCK7459568.1 hypothetical protein [Idiomarina sp. ATCH4]